MNCRSTFSRYALLNLLLIALPIVSWYETATYDTSKKNSAQTWHCPPVKPCCPIFDGTNGAVVDKSTDDTTAGTLRSAILLANGSDATGHNPFVIVFKLPENDTIISLLSDLPVITKPVCIDGFSQPKACEEDRIIIVSLCNNNAENGLILGSAACGSTVKGLSIFGFINGAGITVSASGSLISGTNLGNVTDTFTCGPGTTSAGNNIGILIEAAKNVTIGGFCLSERNVISGNDGTGVRIISEHVTVVGNYIGTDETGIQARGNFVGVEIEGNCNVIGSPETQGSNLIAGNTEANINIIGANNTVINALIGLNISGTHPLPGNRGIILNGIHNIVSHSVVSGNSSENVQITGSYNTVKKCRIGADVYGKKAFASRYGIAFGNGTVAGTEATPTTDNQIKHNLITVLNGTGIRVNNARSTHIYDNLIGSDSTQRCLLGQAIGIDLLSNICQEELFELAQQSARTSHAQPRRFSKKLLATGTGAVPCGTCSVGPFFVDCCPTAPTSFETFGTHITNNIILGNTIAGIRLTTGTRFSTIEKNIIGGNKYHQIVPNGYGILLQRGAQNNSITCNLIVGNVLNGIAIEGVRLNELNELGVNILQTINNSITQNSIFGNCGSGIRLFVNGNNCLGAPLITSATLRDGTLEVAIDTASLPPAPFLIELYGNITCRTCVSEGQVLLGCKQIEKTLTEPELILVSPLKAQFACVTATVTQLTSCFAQTNTSEFSCPVCVEKY